MKVSVVSPLYNSESYLQELYDRLVDVLEAITDDYEIIFVNDGSPDTSLEVAVDIYNNSDKLVVIDLSKNFGQHKAIMTGLQNSTGEIVFIMDADLEEDPEYMKTFVNEYNKDKSFDVIYGVQEKRKGRFFERITGKFFYSLFALLTDLNTSESPTPFRLMTRKFVDAICKFEEGQFFFLGVSNIVGFKQKPLTIIKKMSSITSYTFEKKIKLLFDSVTSFSNKPLVIIFYLGLFICFISLILTSYFLLKYILYGSTLEGWNSIILSVWFIGGIVIFSIGVVGIYLSKIFLEVKNRPFTIIKDVYKK